MKKEKTNKKSEATEPITETDRARFIDETEPKKIPKKNNNSSEYHYRRKAETWLWFGVIVITLAMVLFWIISVKLQISYFSEKKTEKNAVEQVQENWNKVFDENKNDAAKEDAKKQIKAALDKMMAEENARNASSTTSTTNLNTASTTTTTTN